MLRSITVIGLFQVQECINVSVVNTFSNQLLGSSGTFRDLLEVALPEIFNEGL